MSDNLSDHRKQLLSFESAKASLDVMPYSVLVLNDRGVLVYKNRMAVHYMPRVKEGSNVARYSGLDITRDFVKLTEFYGRTSIISSIKKNIEGKNYIIIFVYPSMVGRGDAAARYIENNSDLLERKIEKWLNAVLSQTPHEECRAYINFLLKNKSKINACRGIAKKYLYNIALPEKHATDACLVSPVLLRFKEYIDRSAAQYGLGINVDCPAEIACGISCYDLSYILVCIAGFTMVFTKSKTLDISVREKDDGALITAKIKKRYNIYRMLVDTFFCGEPEEVSDFFYPLQIVNVLAQKCGCDVEYTEHDDIFDITIRVKSCKGLPGMPRMRSAKAVDNGFGKAYGNIISFFDELYENLPERSED